MNALQKFHKTTVELIGILESDQSKDRDDKINKINQLMEEREKLLGGISAPFSPEDEKLGEETAVLNEKLTKLMEKEKQMIQKDIKSLQHKKESSNKYTNPYESLAAQDGVYYDKRN